MSHIKILEALKNAKPITEEMRRKHFSTSSSKGTGKRISDEDKQAYRDFFDNMTELTEEQDVIFMERVIDGEDKLGLVKATITKTNETTLKYLKKGDTKPIIYYYVTKEHIHIAKIDLQRGIDLGVVKLYEDNKVMMTRRKLDVRKYLNGEIV